ncbi:23669_t:CDS:2, partial [Dentiscutata erythropus]
MRTISVLENSLSQSEVLESRDYSDFSNTEYSALTKFPNENELSGFQSILTHFCKASYEFMYKLVSQSILHFLNFKNIDCKLGDVNNNIKQFCDKFDAVTQGIDLMQTTKQGDAKKVEPKFDENPEIEDEIPEEVIDE